MKNEVGKKLKAIVLAEPFSDEDTVICKGEYALKAKLAPPTYLFCTADPQEDLLLTMSAWHEACSVV